MRAVDVRVGHDDDLVVLQPLEVEGPLAAVADAGADAGDQAANFGVLQDAVEPRFFHVQDLALDRQDGLVDAVAALLGRAAGRVALDDEKLGILGVAAGTVRQLAGKTAAGKRGLAHRLARAPGRLAGPCGVEHLLDDLLRDAGIAVEERHQALVGGGGDDALHFRREQLDLGLGLELRIGMEQRDDRHQPLAHVVAGDRRVLVLEEIIGLRVLVDRARQR